MVVVFYFCAKPWQYMMVSSTSGIPIPDKSLNLASWYDFSFEEMFLVLYTYNLDKHIFQRWHKWQNPTPLQTIFSYVHKTLWVQWHEFYTSLTHLNYFQCFSSENSSHDFSICSKNILCGLNWENTVQFMICDP